MQTATGSYTDFLNFVNKSNIEKNNVTDMYMMLDKMISPTWGALNKQYNTQARDLGVTYDLAGQQLQQEANKNISQAYSNYISSQMQMGYAKDLTSGYRDTMNRNIQDAYTNNMRSTELALSSGLKELETKEASDLASLEAQRQQQYAELIGQQQQAYNKEADASAKRIQNYQKMILQKAYEDYGEQYADLFTISDGKVMDWSEEAKAYLYSNNEDNWGLTKEGYEFYSNILQGFDEWMYANRSAQEYSDFVEKDMGIVNNIYTGNEVNQFGADGYGMNAVRDAAETARMNKYKKEQGITSGSDTDYIKEFAQYVPSGDEADEEIKNKDIRKIFDHDYLEDAEKAMTQARKEYQEISQNYGNIMRAANDKRSSYTDETLAAVHEKMKKAKDQYETALEDYENKKTEFDNMYSSVANINEGTVVALDVNGEKYLAYKYKDKKIRYAKDTDEVRAQLKKLGVNFK